ncbi:MAG: DEAD/DEAH box helicase [Proteobacteria bacterium]|nr:DEAD/DEAH box helicase [Pseudomonadota bacterium]
MDPVEFIIPRHAVPSDPHSGLSPLQEQMLNEPAPIRIFSAPTGAGKSYAFQKAMRERAERVLFIVPTRRLAQNLAEGLVRDLMRDGVPEDKALGQVFLWTSDERKRQEAAEPQIRNRDRRIRQVRAEAADSGGGFMVIATPESVACYLLNPQLRSDGIDPENLLDLLRLSHIVFDEFHTIEARGMGMACALATFASQVLGTARISFLSATPIDLKTTLVGFGIPADQIAVAKETVVTGTEVETAGMRAIHGDVSVRIEDGEGLLSSLHSHRAQIIDTLARTDDGRQVVLVYDSVKQLLADKQALAAWFDDIGVRPTDRLAINSVDDSVERELGELFTIGRQTDPQRFKVLVATSSIEMGVTFKAGLILMEPGHDACSFVQRIGRVARGDLSGAVIVHVTGMQFDRHAWLRELRGDLAVQATRIPVDRFIDFVLKAVRARFDVRADELDQEQSVFRRMPQSAIWCAGLFWIALERSAHYKGMKDTLRNFRPRHAATVGALLAKLEHGRLASARAWAKAFVNEAKRLRMILPKVWLIDPIGTRKAIPWQLYASTEALISAPTRLTGNDEVEVLLSSPIGEIEGALGGLRVRRREEVLFPHAGWTKSLELDGIREAWLRVVTSEKRDPGLSDDQDEMLEAAERLVRLSSIVPVTGNEAVADGASLIC